MDSQTCSSIRLVAFGRIHAASTLANRLSAPASSAAGFTVIQEHVVSFYYIMYMMIMILSVSCLFKRASAIREPSPTYHLRGCCCCWCPPFDGVVLTAAALLLFLFVSSLRPIFLGEKNQQRRGPRCCGRFGVGWRRADRVYAL